ncbi:MAG: aromatase/cyclase [Actinobacteria bacterium]|nr:aromatase/cyclase [Actinomycetota bacterium]
MSTQETALIQVEHTVEISAPPRAVYDLVADVTRWPQIFSPTVHIEILDSGPGHELLRLWATANGEVRDWVSRRELDPGALRVDFRQEVPSPPVKAMGGSWLITAAGTGRTRVRLLHDYRAEDEASLPWISAAVDRNSRTELHALKSAAELSTAGIQFSFEDSVLIDGSPEVAYDFLARAELWPTRLDHVASLDLTEDSGGVQRMVMETVTPDASVHTTESIRICFPHERIVYKQTLTPPILSAHTGQWRIAAQDGATLVTSQHSVRLRPDKVTDILGAGTTLDDAADRVRNALSANSRLTLRAAKEFSEKAAAGREGVR